MTLELQRTDVQVDSETQGVGKLRMTHTVTTGSAEAVVLEPLLLSTKDAEALIEALRIAIVRSRQVPTAPLKDADSSRSTFTR
jgi:hypothetical protein